VPGFKKIRFGTHENIGFGPIALPDLELHTRATFWPMPRDLSSRPSGPGVATRLEGPARAAAVLSVGHAVHHCAAMLLMCDVADLGHAITAGHPSAHGGVEGSDAIARLAAAALPWLVLFDWMPGGAGLASTAFELGADLFAHAHAAVAGCRCSHGCPSCLGPGIGDREQRPERAHVLLVLDALRRAAEPTA
jgi:DEAD/DEAH box helicase domain-containing protein